MNALVKTETHVEVVEDDFSELENLMKVISAVPAAYYDQNMSFHSAPDSWKPMCAAGHAYRLGFIPSVTDFRAIGLKYGLPEHVAKALFGSKSTINRILGRPTFFKVRPRDWVKAAKRTIAEQKLVRSL